MERQFGAKIQCIQTNGGGKFTSHQFENYLAQHGILHNVSCPHTPAQNGLVKHRHRTIVETGLTLLFHSKVPNEFWLQSFQTAIHLINRRSTFFLRDNASHFALYGSEADYSCLRVFGCSCYPGLRSYNGNKLQLRYLPCIFLGYKPSYKGYLCYNIESKRFYLSRDVIFDERSFTFLVNQLLQLLIQCSAHILILFQLILAFHQSKKLISCNNSLQYKMNNMYILTGLFKLPLHDLAPPSASPSPALAGDPPTESLSDDIFEPSYIPSHHMVTRSRAWITKPNPKYALNTHVEDMSEPLRSGKPYLTWDGSKQCRMNSLHLKIMTVGS